jgi:hypothetical protein
MACVDIGVRERPYRQGVAYSAHCDPSGGSVDSMTLAISHAENGRAIIDLIREVLTSLSVGEGDLSVLIPAPTFTPGQQVKHNGGGASVIEDRGDTVLLAIRQAASAPALVITCTSPRHARKWERPILFWEIYRSVEMKKSDKEFQALRIRPVSKRSTTTVTLPRRPR